MALYNLSELVKTLKEDAEIGDLPLPVSDTEIIDHLHRKALNDFSIIYPRRETVIIGQENLTKRARESNSLFYEYQIPKFMYAGTVILSVAKVDVLRPNGYSDFYIPTANWSTPDAVIAAMADVRMAAGVASALAKAPTFEFVEPDIIKLYNGWAGGAYEVELLLRHDDSLATIPSGAMTNFRELCLLDLKAYLYAKLKRKQNLETGVGSIDLKIDDWSNAAENYRDMIKEWQAEASVDFDHIYRY